MDMISTMLFTLLPLLSVIALWIGSLFDQRFANIVYKLHLLRTGLTHMLFSKDRKWKKQPDSDGVTVEESKQIIFIRHGESKWNLVFNKGFGPSFPVRLASAIGNEFKQSITLDSVFVDSPLSKEGCDQAKGLYKYIESGKDEVSAILKGTEGESVVCSSNLRRALSTCTIGMWDRIQRSQEKVKILSCLQEVTFNIDGVALAKPQGYPELCDEELDAFGKTKESFHPERYYDARENDGDKPVSSQGISRIKDFAAWCFEREEPTVVAAGHSLYFRYFFDTFLPKKSLHESRINKMENCAVVSFSLHKGKTKSGKTWYSIDESSINASYLGFEQKKSKKKKN